MVRRNLKVKDRSNLTIPQGNYNYLLSKNRHLIEHCFGLLKQRFRQLYHIKLRKIEDIVHFIRACAVLYNLSVEHNLVQDDIHEQPNEVLVIPEYIMHDEEDAQDDRDGIAKRNDIMNNLPFRLN